MNLNKKIFLMALLLCPVVIKPVSNYVMFGAGVSMTSVALAGGYCAFRMMTNNQSTGNTTFDYLLGIVEKKDPDLAKLYRDAFNNSKK